MKSLRRMAAIGFLAVFALCGWTRAQQVLDQVPSDALGVFEVKDLQGVSQKLAAMAKTLGVDQFDKRWADPLASLQDEMDLKQGVNKGGDMAIAFFKPAKAQGEGEQAKQPNLVVILPTDDYKAFLGNFQDVKDEGGGISQVTIAKANEKVFIEHRGGYAVAAKDKDLLSHQTGLKLPNVAANEAKAKDAILWVNLKPLRPDMQKEIKEGMQKLKELQANPAVGAQMQMSPAIQTLITKAADQFINDTNSIAISLNLNDTGIGASFLSEFEPDSYFGKLAAQLDKTDQSLLSGLPDRKYFMFGGALITAKVGDQIISDVFDTIKNDLPNNGQEMSKAVDAFKGSMGVSKSASFGMVAPAAGESFLQTVAVTRGDAKTIAKNQAVALPASMTMTGISNPNATADVKLNGSKTIDGVDLQQYTVNFNIKGNDAMAMQQKQMMAMMFGPNGLHGVMGAVNDQAFLQVQGGSDELINQAIEAAKNNADTLSTAAHVKLVSAQLPKQRALEYYVALDNILTSVMNLMRQQGLAIPFRLPADLPPIGVAVGSEESTARCDAFVPTQLVQSVVAAGMQAWMQMQGGGGKGGGI